MNIVPHVYRPVTHRDGNQVCGDCYAWESDPIHIPGMIALKALMEAGRKIDFRFVHGHYIVTAIPLDFEGGPVPDGWRSTHEDLNEAIKTLLRTWKDPPTDFKWEDTEVYEYEDEDDEYD